MITCLAMAMAWVAAGGIGASGLTVAPSPVERAMDALPLRLWRLHGPAGSPWFEVECNGEVESLRPIALPDGGWAIERRSQAVSRVLHVVGATTTAYTFLLELEDPDDPWSARMRLGSEIRGGHLRFELEDPLEGGSTWIDAVHRHQVAHRPARSDCPAIPIDTSDLPATSVVR